MDAENIRKNMAGTDRSISMVGRYAISDFNAWKNSTGHNRNMLNPILKKIGYGFAINDNMEMYSTQ